MMILYVCPQCKHSDCVQYRDFILNCDGCGIRQGDCDDRVVDWMLTYPDGDFPAVEESEYDE